VKSGIDQQRLTKGLTEESQEIITNFRATSLRKNVRTSQGKSGVQFRSYVAKEELIKFFPGSSIIRTLPRAESWPLSEKDR